MISWRGWGLLVMFIGLFPLIMTVPFALQGDPTVYGKPPPSITGYFVWPLLISAALTCGLDRLLRHSVKRHDLMSISVRAWIFVFIGLALVVAALWAAEKLGMTF